MSTRRRSFSSLTLWTGCGGGHEPILGPGEGAPEEGDPWVPRDRDAQGLDRLPEPIERLLPLALLREDLAEPLVHHPEVVPVFEVGRVRLDET